MDMRLENLDKQFPPEWDAGRVARAKTVFFKELALAAHRFYGRLGYAASHEGFKRRL